VEWDGRVTSMRSIGNGYKIFVEELGRKMPLRRTRHRKKDNIKVDFKYI
jgi:hypothetical protein